MKYHDNHCTIKGNGLKAVKYVSGSFEMTDGQKKKGKPKVYQTVFKETLPEVFDHVWYFKVTCGRKGSEDVRDDFFDYSFDRSEQQCMAPCAYDGAEKWISGHTMTHSPKTMNFFCKLELTMSNDEVVPVLLGQAGRFGEMNTQNVWLMRGPDLCLNVHPNRVTNGFCIETPDESTWATGGLGRKHYALAPSDECFEVIDRAL
ncbi:MAG: hypothetical protein GJ677_11910 [Rhodobacteraceae bacterium]|nr:hypothetical protein [Paracoccaceae bacterium]